MASDAETIAVYDAKVDDYTKTFAHKEIDPALIRFMESLPQCGTKLDFGCGPGRHAQIMHENGFVVTATDASTAMVENARGLGDFKVEQAEFHELSAVSDYDGIWANFSLLHAPRSEFPGHIKTISKALKPDGIFHLGMKLGIGEQRDHLGRRYSYFSAKEFQEFLTAEGFAILDETLGESSGLAGTIDPWIEILAQKKP